MSWEFNLSIMKKFITILIFGLCTRLYSQFSFTGADAFEKKNGMAVCIDAVNNRVTLFSAKDGIKWSIALTNTEDNESKLRRALLHDQAVYVVTDDGSFFKLDLEGKILSKAKNLIPQVVAELQNFGSEFLFARVLVPNPANDGYIHLIYRINCKSFTDKVSKREVSPESKLIVIDKSLMIADKSGIAIFSP